ncbi:hypothetical protein DSECCO2_271960 [anaerobic digester metagenome]
MLDLRMTHRFTLLAIVIITSALLGAGCTSAPSPDPTPTTLTVTDMANRTVEVGEHPDRVVGVGAGTLRMLVYLGAIDRVVGVDERDRFTGQPGAPGMPSGNDRPYLLAHPEIGNLSSVGRITGDPEQIMAQHPDVVFLSFTTGKDAQTLQDKTGIPVVSIVSGDLGTKRPVFYSSLRTMAKVLGEEARAEEVITYVDATIADLERRTSDIPNEKKPSVYIGGVAFNGAHGLLSTDPAYAPFMLLGARNVADGVGPGGQIIIDKEKLIEWNPDLVFVDQASASSVRNDLADPVLGSLGAVKSGKVYGVLPYNWYANNYDTVLADAYAIGKLLYPDRFADVDPEQKADEIYTALDGRPVYMDLKEHFGGFGPFEAEQRG